MSQIYVSGPWSFASGVLQVVKSIKVKSRADKVVYSEKGTEYQFSKLEQSDYVVFVLDDPLDFLNVEQPKSYFY